MISILMPAYNCGPFVAEAIQSIQAQSFKDWELIVVDDGSDDATAAKAAHAAAADPRVTVVTQPRLGYAKAFNRCFELSSGEIIARQDADDLSQPDRLAKQLARLEASKWQIVTCGMSRMFGEEVFDDPCTGMEPLRYLTDRVPKGPCGASIVCRRDIYMQVGVFRSEFEYAADSDWNLRALACMPPLPEWVHVPEPLYVYRQHPGSMTSRGQRGLWGKQVFDGLRREYGTTLLERYRETR